MNHEEYRWWVLWEAGPQPERDHVGVWEFMFDALEYVGGDRRRAAAAARSLMLELMEEGFCTLVTRDWDEAEEQARVIPPEDAITIVRSLEFPCGAGSLPDEVRYWMVPGALWSEWHIAEQLRAFGQP